MTSDAPFVVPNGVGTKPGPWRELQVLPYSDGDQRYWPPQPSYRPSSEIAYRMKLATAWAEQDGKAERNVNYYLSSLPAGYGVFETDKPDLTQVYKRLWGHPSGRFYDSIVRFQTHFFWLVSGMEGSCECVLCSGKLPAPLVRRQKIVPEVPRITERSRRTREVQMVVDHDSTRSNSASGLAFSREKRQPKARAVDEEGTEDVWKDAIGKIYKNRDSRVGIEIDIQEEDSIDWRAERKSLPVYLTQIDQQHSFIPRIGELVLWCKYFPDQHYLMYDSENGEHKFYSFDQKCFHGFPDWRGGVVTQVPTSSQGENSVDFPDLLDEPAKKTSLNTSGFRIETLPDPNDFDKSTSKQYKYVPLRHIRPLSHWQFLMRGIPEKRWHSSIKYSLTCMTSLSLVEKWRVNGEWPNATIRCKGLYLGAELITIGDTVRIAEQRHSKISSNGLNGSAKCTDLLVLTDIRLNLEKIYAGHVEPDSPFLASRSSISLIGKAYTIDPRRDYRNATQATKPEPVDSELVKSLFRPVGTGEYGDWYPLHADYHRYEVSYDRVLGRLHEADAVRLWTGLSQNKPRPAKAKQKPALNFDISGIFAGRAYATATDERIPEASDSGQVLWHWADTRAMALALETINGLEVGQYHKIRDRATLRTWRAQLRVVDGAPIAQYEKETGMKFGQRGRKAGSKLINGRVIGPDMEIESSSEREPSQKFKSMGSSQMVGAALADTDHDDEIDDDNDMKATEIFDNDNAADDGLEKIPQTDSAPKSMGKMARTKREIMTSIEGNDEFDDDVPGDDEDDYAFLNEPLPIRGGTEESEGGDYNPKVEDFQKASSGIGSERPRKVPKYDSTGQK